MRNYKKEREWEEQTYMRICTKIKKDLGEKFKEKLKEDNIVFTHWLVEKINEYLSEEK